MSIAFFVAGCEDDPLSSKYKRTHFAGDWTLGRHERTYFLNSGDSLSVIGTKGKLHFDVDAAGGNDPVAFTVELCDSVAFLAGLKNTGAFEPISGGSEYRGFWTYASDLSTMTIWGEGAGIFSPVTADMVKEEKRMEWTVATYGGNSTMKLMQEVVVFTKD